MPTRRAVLRSASGLAVVAATGLWGSSGASSASPAVRTDPWERLRDELTGDLVRPSDTGYQGAKTVYLGEFSATDPRAVASCQTVRDVQACLRFAREHGVRMHTRSGGHNLAGWSTGPGLVVDLSRFDHAKVTPSTVHMGPGLPAIDLLAALRPHGKQVVTGTCPTVCPGGFVSGGGIGHQTRKFGTASDRLVSALVVLADGEVVRVSADREPDLFWALRGGGGGNFGIVLDYEVRPIDQPAGVFFDTAWPWEKAPEVIEAWQEWSVSSGHGLGSALIVALPDAAPGAVPTIMLTGAYWGPRTELDGGLAELAAQSGATPSRQQVADGEYHDVMRQVYGCGQLTVDECHLVGQNPDATLPRNGVLRERTRIYDRPVTGPVLTDALTAYDADRAAGQTRFLAFTATGGVANEASRTETAYWHRDAQFMTGFAAMTQNAAPPEDEEAAMVAWVDRGNQIIEPVSTGEAYVNFPDARMDDWQHAYYGDNYAKLRAIKRDVDPGNLFRHAQSVER